MKRVLLVSSDPTLIQHVRSALPAEWKLTTVASKKQADAWIEKERPDTLFVDLELETENGLSILEEMDQGFDLTLPVVLFAPEEVDGATAKRASMLPLTGLIHRPFLESKFKALFDSVEHALISFDASLPELLGYGFRGAEPNLVSCDIGSASVSFLFSGGRLYAFNHPLFRERYEKNLAEAGFKMEGRVDRDGRMDPAALEERMGGAAAMVTAKESAILSVLAGCSLDAYYSVHAEKATIPKGLVAIDIPSILAKLVEHVSPRVLGVLKNPKISLIASGDAVPADLPIQPSHGYILYQCQAERPLQELLQTGALPEEQLFSGVYLLLLLGLLVAKPGVGDNFGLKGLVESIKLEEHRIRRQSGVIENLFRNLRTPGESPYAVLNIKPGTNPSEAYGKVEVMRRSLSRKNLHPEVYKKYGREILFIRAKYEEALLILQTSFIDNKRAVMKKEGAKVTEGVSSMAGSKTERQEISERRIAEARKFFETARRHFEEEDFHESSQFLKLALLENPFLSEAHHLMAKVYEKSSDRRAKHLAESEYQRSVELDPWRVDYLLDLAEFYTSHDQAARGRAYLKKAHAIDRKSARALALRRKISEQP